MDYRDVLLFLYAEVVDGNVYYRDPGTKRWYRIQAGLDRLVELLGSTDREVVRDAYSQWCAEVPAEEQPEGWDPMDPGLLAWAADAVRGHLAAVGFATQAEVDEVDRDEAEAILGSREHWSGRDGDPTDQEWEALERAARATYKALPADETARQALAVVAEYGDDEDDGPEDAEEAAEAFRRVFGRAPDADEAADAWSHVCAATSFGRRPPGPQP